MRLVLDMRINEDWARKHLAPGVGRPMSQGPGIPVLTRQVILDAEDPLVEQIKEKVLAWEGGRQSATCFVNLDFIYEREELARATLLHFRPTVLLNTFGERHGTIYDDTNACPKCGAGRVQRSPLILDPKYLRKKKTDFLVTITADEWLVSAKLAKLLNDITIPDCSLDLVHDLHGDPIDEWFQLKVHRVFGSAVTPTKFGLDFFHEDTKGEYVCEEHGLSGLNVNSELFVRSQKSGPLPDLSITRNRVGEKRGWLVPTPFLLVTRRLADILLERKVRGFRLDVAHIV